MLTDDQDMVIFEGILRSDGGLESGMKRDKSGGEPILSVAAITETFSREKAEYLIRFNHILTRDFSIKLPSSSFPFKKPTLSNTNDETRLKEDLDMIRCLISLGTTHSSLFKCAYLAVIGVDSVFKRRFEGDGFSVYEIELEWKDMSQFIKEYLAEKTLNRLRLRRCMSCSKR